MGLPLFIIHFNWMFPYQPAPLGQPQFRKPILHYSLPRIVMMIHNIFIKKKTLSKPATNQYTGFLWFSYGFPTVFLWFSYGLGYII